MKPSIAAILAVLSFTFGFLLTWIAFGQSLEELALLAASFI